MSNVKCQKPESSIKYLDIHNLQFVLPPRHKVAKELNAKQQKPESRIKNLGFRY